MILVQSPMDVTVHDLRRKSPVVQGFHTQGYRIFYILVRDICGLHKKV